MKNWIQKSTFTSSRIEYFVKKYSTDKKTLDLACGTGKFIKYFPNRIGIDIVKTPAVGIVADVHDLSMFSNEEFDVVLCTEALEHFYDPQKVIDEVFRVLKKKGVFILTTRFIFPLHEIPYDYYRYTKFGLKYLLRNFKIINIEEEYNSFGTLAVLFERLRFQTEQIHFRRIYQIFFFVLARIVKFLSKIIQTKEYGDIARNKPVDNFITSGYYFYCSKE